jgi:hypothetical protein
MRACALFLTLLALAAPAAISAEPPAKPAGPGPLETSCVNCHSQLDGAALEPTKHTGDDIHFAKGLSCNDCHGGDPTAGFDGDPMAAHDEAKGFKGKPSRLNVPDFCAKCHADAVLMKRFDPGARVDQLSEYRTSVHGKRNAAGDEKTAVCVDCHGVHGIRAVDDPRSSVYPSNVAETCSRCHADQAVMKAYNLPTQQYAEYKTSVHARALYEKGDTQAPTCNDCHGSHGAVPPGVENVANVCGSCHGREATLFRETQTKVKLDLTPCIRCVICHGNHAVKEPSPEMLGVGPASTCTPCHGEGEKGYVAAAKMADSLQRLRSTISEAHDLLDRAERAGMEVGPDRFALQAAQDGLVESRVLAHSFDLERFTTAASGGLTVAEAGIAAGRRAFDELRYRRMGLAFSLIVISAVIVALSLKVRRMER